jgi:hypothetical protein
MLEKIIQRAEQAATGASRRQFLGRFGRSALALAAAVAGTLALPEQLQAARKCGGRICPPGYNYCCNFLDHAAGKRIHYCAQVPCAHPS